MTRKSIFMILAGFILMSGCTSYSGVGIADNGKPYYFDDKCVKYRWSQNRDDIQCLDSNGIVTGYRQPIPWELTRKRMRSYSNRRSIKKRQYYCYL